MEKAFGKKTIFMRRRRFNSYVVDFVKNLSAPALLMGLGLDSEKCSFTYEHMDLNHLN